MESKPIRRISPNFEISVDFAAIIAIIHPSGAVFLTDVEARTFSGLLAQVVEQLRTNPLQAYAVDLDLGLSVRAGLDSLWPYNLDPERLRVNILRDGQVIINCEAWELAALISGLAALRDELAAEFEEQMAVMQAAVKERIAVWGTRPTITVKAVPGGAGKTRTSATITYGTRPRS